MSDLQNQLYSRTHPPKARARRHLRPDTHQVEEGWEKVDEVEEERAAQEAVKRQSPNAKKRRARGTRSALTFALLASFGFFLISAATAAYLLSRDTNTISPEKIDVEITSPLQVGGGEPLLIQLGITNGNTVPIEAASLVVEYPRGTRAADDVTIPLERSREDIGVILPGERQNVSLRAVLYGDEQTTQDIAMALEYRIEGSSATFVKEIDHSVLLSTAPLSISVDGLEELSSDQPVELRVAVVSNATEQLDEVLLVGDYPFGFRFSDAEPAPTAGEAVWNLGSFAPGEAKEVVVNGVLTGLDTQDRLFRFDAGIPAEESPTEIAAVLNQAEHTIVLKQPFMNLALLFDRTPGGGAHVVGNRDAVVGEITWENTLDESLFGAEMVVSFDGALLDPRAIESRDGFFRSQDTTIRFNEETEENLARIDPGESGRVRFEFAPRRIMPSMGLVDPELWVSVDVRAQRFNEEDVPEEIESTLRRRVLVATDMELTTQPLYSAGPFENEGPIPPEVEERTTYTLLLTVRNTNNDLRDVEVYTELPWYVEWLGEVEPAGEDLRYNEVTKELRWTLGDVPRGTGYTLPARTLAFQVAIEPSLSQKGSEVVLLYEQFARGVDVYTGRVIELTNDERSTYMRTDPEFGGRTWSKVQER
jgi:hypothetical protein